MKKNPINYIAHLDRRLKALIERRILSSNDAISARRFWFGTAYMKWRCLLLKWALRSGLWIPSGLRVTLSLILEPGDTFLDIGANVGMVTQPAAWLVGRYGQVHSFEPSPSTIGYLRRRLVCMGISNVATIQTALGAASGVATLYECSENFGGSSSLRPGAAPGQHISVDTAVSIKALDDYVTQNCISSVRLIKMDVQGSEIDILRGAKKLLESPNRPVLYVEIEKVANAAFGYSINDLLSVLKGYGYDMFSWRDSGLVSVKSDNDIPQGGHDDVICLSPGSHDVILRKLQHLADFPTFKVGFNDSYRR